MAIGANAATRSRTLGILGAWASDVFAGLIASTVTIAYGLSFAALIFAPPLNDWLAYGIAATFITSAVCAALVALRSSLPFAIAGPDPTTVAVTASLVSALMAHLAARGPLDDLLAAVAIIMALSAALSGLLLLGLGFARAGGAIRFVPYPVIGGFLGATGCLMISGALRVITGFGTTAADLDALLGAAALAKLAPAAVVAFALYVARRRYPDSAYVVPAVLIAGIAAGHVLLASTGTNLRTAETLGWLFKPPAAVGLTPSWDLNDLRPFPWSMLPSLAGDLLAVMFVTAISTLINTTGLEFLTRREADLQRELTAVGAANLITAGLGGYVSTIALNRSTLNYMAGGRSRLSGMTVAAISALMLFTDPGFLSYVPKFVVGGLLLYLGANLVYEWLFDSVQRLSLVEYGSLLAITLLILQFGFIAGIFIGVIIGCATFAVSASRISAIKFTFDGSEYRSTLDRKPEEAVTLGKHGPEIQGMSLQGYLFFGSANKLYQQVKELLQKRPGTRFLLFDFRLVTGLDSSALHSFMQIKRAAHEAGARIVLVNLSDELREAFYARKFLTDDVMLADDLDRALEVCEQAVIEAHSAGDGEVRTFADWLCQALGSAEFAEQLMQQCTRLEVAKGDIIARQGDPAGCMHFILEGRIGVNVKTDDGRVVRLRSLGPHTTIGEMGLITRQTRSATIQAEAPSVLYELNAGAFDRIKRENAQLAEALLTYIIKVMTERLSFASRAIGVLRR